MMTSFSCIDGKGPRSILQPMLVTIHIGRIPVVIRLPAGKLWRMAGCGLGRAVVNVGNFPASGRARLVIKKG